MTARMPTPGNARNRLVSALSGASFQYDSFGRRVGKTISGVTTNYLYDGANTVQELSGGALTANPLRANIRETSLVPLFNEQGEKGKGGNEQHVEWVGF